MTADERRALLAVAAAHLHALAETQREVARMEEAKDPTSAQALAHRIAASALDIEALNAKENSITGHTDPIEAQVAGDRLYRTLWEQRWSVDAGHQAANEYITAHLTEDQRNYTLMFGFSTLLSQWTDDEETLRKWVRRVLEIDAAKEGA